MREHLRPPRLQPQPRPVDQNPMATVDPFGNQPPALPPPRRRIFPAFPIAMITLTAILGLRLLLLPGATQTLGDLLRSGTESGSEQCRSLSAAAAGGPEGSCVRWSSRFDAPTTFVVVNGSHLLRMPEYTAIVGGSVIRGTRVRGYASEYPGGHGQLVSYRLTVTNTTAATLDFGAGGVQARGPHYARERIVELMLREPNGPYPEISYGPLLSGIGAPRPDTLGPIPPHSTARGWVTFLIPDRELTLLSLPGARLDFLRPEHRSGYTGQVRL
jgi:hypothetical protein